MDLQGELSIAVHAGEMTVNAWLSQADQIWRTQAALGGDESLRADALNPRMYMIHWSTELYLKGLLMDAGVDPTATHDLVASYERAVVENPSVWTQDREDAVKRIETFGHDEFGGVRYPAPTSYTLDSADVARTETLFAQIRGVVTSDRNIDRLVPRLTEVLGQQQETLRVARSPIQRGTAVDIDQESVFAFLVVSKQIEYWQTEVARIGWRIGPISDVSMVTAIAAAAGLNRVSQLTKLLKDAKLWGSPFLNSVRTKQEAEVLKLIGRKPERSTLDRQGVPVYFLVAMYPEIFTLERLEQDFGWGSTTAVVDAAEEIRDVVMRQRGLEPSSDR